MKYNCDKLSQDIRKRIILMAEYCENIEGYWGGYLSMVEILAVLYGDVMNLKDVHSNEINCDKFILSKGHSGLAMYVAMYETGIITKQQLLTYNQKGSGLTHLASKNRAIGVECSGGSLGLGLPLAVGYALLAKRKNFHYKTYVIVGDGEIQEGANWEAMLSASKYKLDNLILVIDYNKNQSDGSCVDIMPLDNLKNKLESFGWDARECDGHSCTSLQQKLYEKSYGKPIAIIAHTIKGKGLYFMENNNNWHHLRMSENELVIAKKELGLEQCNGNKIY